MAGKNDKGLVFSCQFAVVSVSCVCGVLVKKEDVLILSSVFLCKCVNQFVCAMFSGVKRR